MGGGCDGGTAIIPPSLMGGEKLESFGIIASLYFSALLILEFARGRTSLGYEEIKYKFIGFWCLQVNESLRPGNRHPLHTVRSIRHPAEVPSLWRLSHWPSHPSEPNPASDGDGFHPPSPSKMGGEGGNDGGNKGWEEAHHRWGGWGRHTQRADPSHHSPSKMGGAMGSHGPSIRIPSHQTFHRHPSRRRELWYGHWIAHLIPIHHSPIAPPHL